MPFMPSKCSSPMPVSTALRFCCRGQGGAPGCGAGGFVFFLSRLFWAFCLWAWLLGGQGWANAEEAPWKELEPGLHLAEFDREDQSQSHVVVLRFDPVFFTFSLHMTSQDGTEPKTLRQWADRHDLVAAINASMYLTDGSTSTGYMRNGAHVNNKRIVKRFGAFFVSMPHDPHLPSVALIDRDMENWEELLTQYKIVIQNYRMINAKRNILWSPGGPLYSISAVGQDEEGKILFIHCREPIEAYSFASLLLHLPIKVRTVMYVEGGAQAGLALRTEGYSHLWGGRHPADFLITGKVNVALPNVLGVSRKKSNELLVIPDK